MLQELAPNQYKRINHLPHRDFISVQCQTVINQSNPGFIYVDSLENPRTAMVFHQGEAGFYFIGHHVNTAFNHSILGFIQTQVKERLRRLGLDSFEFSGDSPAWDRVFRMIFKDTGLWESKQRIYLGSKNETIQSSSIDPSICIREIQEDLLHDDTIGNASFISDEVLEFWESWKEFSSSAGGLYVRKGRDIIGKCVADGVTDEHISVRIEVKEGFRNQGIASQLSSQFIQWVSDRGRSLYWECDDENPGSIKLAEKNGLSLSCVYSLFGFELK